MTIDQAIKVLTTERRFCLAIDAHERYQALDLGIEALKRIEEGRAKGYSNIYLFAAPLTFSATHSQARQRSNEEED